jgi:hypothetical protein
MLFEPRFPSLKQGLVYGWHGQALMALHDYHEAYVYFLKAVHCSAEAGPDGDARVADYVSSTARAMLRMDDMPGALKLVDGCEVAARHKAPLAHFIILTAQASLLWDAHQADRARRAYKAASQIAGMLHLKPDDRDYVHFVKIGQRMHMH